MDVGMGYLHSKYGHPYSLAGNGRLESYGHLAGKCPQALVNRGFQIKNIVILNVLGDTRVCPSARGLMSRNA